MFKSQFGQPFSGRHNICKLFGSSKQAYYKRDLSQLQTRLLQEQIAIDYALSIRQSDPGIGAKKLHAMYCKESACEGKPLSRDHFSRLLKEHNITISMTEDGNPKHNAIAERINNTIKNEFFAKLSFESIEEVRENVRKAVEFYNQRRPHMSINGLTPAEAAELSGEIKKQWCSYREQAIKGLAM